MPLWQIGPFGLTSQVLNSVKDCMNHTRNLQRQDYSITRANRSKMLGQHPVVIWFTGLSGSGKSTLADRLEQELHKIGILTMLLDGDNIRHGLNKNVDFSEEGRRENIRRIGEVARLFNDAGVVVLTAFISPYRNDRDQVRALLPEHNFIEVFVDCPVETCEARDVKGLYQKARAGEIKDFTGINAPFEVPLSPEIIVKTAEQNIEECVKQLLRFILPRIKLKTE